MVPTVAAVVNQDADEEHYTLHFLCQIGSPFSVGRYPSSIHGTLCLVAVELRQLGEVHDYLRGFFRLPCWKCQDSLYNLLQILSYASLS
ncbi:hypothetical protein FGO68_gene13496 [Halteria grandinella]|uniref:Uncharacterized protein n=1 Tax=Halteria grandinella TaxID=5974 RepID=A0A8J8NWN8_HALGN|nr:hypothetical protein FGO68_gene13496 [Halteria grandinella]